MSSRLLVLAPTFGVPSGAINRSLAQLGELGFDTLPVNLQSGVRRIQQVATSEIGPLSSRLAAAAAHELAGDADVRLGFLGGGPLAVIASVAGARTARTEGMVALFPEHSPLLPSAAPSLVIADAKPNDLGELQRAWGPAAQIVLADRAKHDLVAVNGVTDPVSELVADFATRTIGGEAVPGGLANWMRERGVAGLYPLTALERKRLVASLEKELVAQLEAKGRQVGLSQRARVGRVATVLAGLGAAQMAGLAGLATASAVVSGAATVKAEASWNAASRLLDVQVPGLDAWVEIGCSTASGAVLVDGSTVSDGNDAVTCDEVSAIDVRPKSTGTDAATAISALLDLDLVEFDNIQPGDPTYGTNPPGTSGTSYANPPGTSGTVTGTANPPGQSGTSYTNPPGTSVTSTSSCFSTSTPFTSSFCFPVPGGTNPPGTAGTSYANPPGTSGTSYDNPPGTSGTVTGTANPAGTNTPNYPDAYSRAVDVNISGGAGDDLIQAQVTGWIDLSADLGSGNDIFALNNGATSAIAAVSTIGGTSGVDGPLAIDIDGGAGDDAIALGSIVANEASITHAVDIHGDGTALTSGSGNDVIDVAGVRVQANMANVNLAIDLGGGDDRLTVGSALAASLTADRAGFDLDVAAGSGNDVILVGDITGAGLDTRVAVDVLGSSGTDHLDIGSFDGDGRLRLSVLGGSGDDVLDVANEGLQANKYAQVFVSGGDGVDHVRVATSQGVDFAGAFKYANITVAGGGGDDFVTVGSLNVDVGAGNAILVHGGTAQRKQIKRLVEEAAEPDGDDVISVGDIHVRSGHNLDADVFGSDGSDVIVVGNAYVDASGRLDLDVRGGRGSAAFYTASSSAPTADGSDVIDVGALRAQGASARLFVDVRGSAGADDIAIYGVSVTEDADSGVDVDLDVKGGHGLYYDSSDASAYVQTASFMQPDLGDVIDIGGVGGLTLLGDGARVDLDVTGSAGADTISFGVLALSGERVNSTGTETFTANHAYVDVAARGGFPDLSGTFIGDLADDIKFGDVHVPGQYNRVDLSISLSLGDDVLTIGGVDVGPGAQLDLYARGGGGKDLVSLGALDVPAEASLGLGIDLGTADDLLVIAGPAAISGVLRPLSGESVMFSGGTQTVADTFSFATTFAPFVTDGTLSGEFVGNSMVTEFENLVSPVRSSAPPATGGGGGATSPPANPIAAGGSIATSDSTEATRAEKVIAKVTLPGGGSGSVAVQAFVADDVDDQSGNGAGVAPSERDDEYGAVQVTLDVQHATPEVPYEIELILDPTIYTPGAAGVEATKVMLNGVAIPDCPDAGDTCIKSGPTLNENGDYVIVIETTHNSVLTFAVDATNQQNLFCDSRSDGRYRYFDVPTGSPHREAIECLADAGVITGVSAQRFAPTALLTRAQASSIIVRAADVLGVTLPSGESGEFSDVDPNSPHGQNITRLAEAGILTGFGDGTFKPAASVSRAQFAKIMDRMFEVATTSTPETVDVFSDDDGTFLEEFMNQAAALGLLQGDGAGDGTPGNPISRAQAASIIARFAGRLVAAGF